MIEVLTPRHLLSRHLKRAADLEHALEMSKRFDLSGVAALRRYALGYDVREKALVVNEAEAETVQLIFRRYLELGSVRGLKAWLDREGIVSKHRISRAGRRTGGVRLTRGALYALLRNPLYMGEIAHRGERHRGRHDAIVSRDLWDRVQRGLEAANGGRPKRSAARRPQRPLDGLLFDEHGRPMKPVSTSRPIGRSGGRRTYHYYASTKTPEDGRAASRLPAAELEAFLCRRLSERLADASSMAAALRSIGAAPGQIAKAVVAAEARATDLTADAVRLRYLIERIDVADDRIAIALRSGGLIEQAETLPSPVFHEALETSQAGRARPIVLGGTADKPRHDPELIALVADARRWMRSIASGEVSSVQAITEQEGQGKGRVSRILPLAFLAPDIAEAILEGRQPLRLTASCLRALPELPLDWKEQRKFLGFAAA